MVREKSAVAIELYQVYAGRWKFTILHAKESAHNAGAPIKMNRVFLALVDDFKLWIDDLHIP